MKINIVAGGPEELLPNLHEYEADSVIWAGVDRGVFNLLKFGLKPRIAFGDFDSVSEEELLHIEKQVKEMKRFMPEKDETDMELALNWALEQQPDEIRIFGATGGRIDHFFANVQLLVNPLKQNQKVDILIVDVKNILFIKGPGTYRIKKNLDKKYISFVPITQNVESLTLSGFKYPLNNRHISIGTTLCISNELIGDYGTFSFSEGILLVIRSDD